MYIGMYMSKAKLPIKAELPTKTKLPTKAELSTKGSLFDDLHYTIDWPSAPW